MGNESAAPAAAVATPASGALAGESAANVSAPVNTNAGAQSSPSDWTSGLSEELKTYQAGKNFKDPAAVLEGYRNLEKLRGVPSERLATIPERHDDAAGWNQLFSKIGRPDKPDGYGIPQGTPESDKENVAAVQKIFYEAGLSVKQAEIFNAKLSEHANNTRQAAEVAQQAKAKAEEDGLKKEWGAAFEQNLNIGRQAAKTFGLNAETIDKLESALGFSATLKLFQNIGSKLGEGDFIVGSGPGGKQGVLTPQQASAKIEQRMSDKNFWKRYMDGEASAREEMEALHKWKVGDV